jgi:bacteriorhodopsin
MKIIHSSGWFSLCIQIVTIIIDTYALSIKTPPSLHLVKQLLWIEYIVNLVEGSFYVWMVYHFTKIKNITVARYYDWIVTTPIMLFTYSIYILNKKKAQPDLYTAVYENKIILVTIVLLNWTMLFFGYLSETGNMDARISTPLGFIPFSLMFYLIYDNYAKYSSIGVKTFYYIIFIWGLYGVAALLSYNIKNVMYNILDLFSKNFFALFLAYLLIHK